MNQQFCTQCGARLPETGAFCPQCGARTARAGAQPDTPGAAARESAGREPVAAAPAAVPADPAAAAPRRSPLLIPLAVLALAVLIGGAAYFAALRGQQAAAPVEACVAGEDCAATLPAGEQNGEGIPYPEVRRISVAEARDGFDAGQVLFIDVRDRDSWAAAHIPGSLSLPLDELEAGMAGLPGDVPIITYCT